MIKQLLMPVMMSAAVFSAAAYETNTWKGPDDGKWGDPANWSLERVPTSDDYTVFPYTDSAYSIDVDGNYEIRAFHIDAGDNANRGTITLTGSGSVHSSGPQENYVRGNRKLILDGASVKLTGNYLMTYSPITVKNGSTFETVGRSLTLWKTNPELHVEAGGTVVVDGEIRNYARAVVNVNGGSLSAKKILHYGDSTGGMAISVTAGSLTAEDVSVTNGSSLAVSGGKFKATGTIGLVDWENVTLDLTGGTVVLPKPNFPERILTENKGATIEYVVGNITVEGPVTDKALLENLDGGSLTVTVEHNRAVDVFTEDGETVVVGGKLVLEKGYMAFSNKVTIASDYPLITRGFHNSGPEALPTIHFSEIVFDKYAFTSTPATSGEARTYHFEGPTTFRSRADMAESSGRSTYSILSGDFTIDTRDYYDSSVKRRMAFRGLGAKAAATLTVCGGGELWLMQTRTGSPFSRVSVEAGTTLTLASLGTAIDYGPLHTDEFVLGPNAVLNIPAGSNSVHAVRWEVDPTAVINIIVPEGLTPEAKGLLYDFACSYRVPESQIRLVGETDAALEGWGLVPADGTWAMTNAAADVTADETYEWTGLGETARSQDPANWTGITRPMEKEIYKFGAASVRTKANFHRFYQDETIAEAKGSTIGGVRFRETAVTTFEVYGEGGITYNNKGTYGAASIVSYSAVPHRITGNGIRGFDPSFHAVKDGPLVVSFSSDFQKRSASGKFTLGGDIRFAPTAPLTFPQIGFFQLSNGNAHRCFGSRFTLLSGNLTLTNQTTAFSIGYTGFNIGEGAELTFNNGSGNAFYQWDVSAHSAMHKVDGTLNLNLPFRGGADQAYEGSGTMNIQSIVPHTRESRVSFCGNLTVNLPAAWPTVTSDAPDTPFALKAYGTPLIRTAGGWTYGAAEGVESQVSAAKRAAQISKGAVLTVDPSGGVVTFNDPLSGRGTLAITNGVLRIPGGTVYAPGIEVRAGAVFECGAPLVLRSLSCAGGATVKFTAFAPISFLERVDLSAVNAEWADGALGSEGKEWRTLFASKAGFTGELASVTAGNYTRIVETADGFEYQIRPKFGMTVTFR